MGCDLLTTKTSPLDPGPVIERDVATAIVNT